MSTKDYNEKNTRSDFELDKFAPSSTNRVAIRTIIENSTPIAVTSDAVAFDRIDGTYPNDYTEVYTYSLNAVDVLITTIIYTDSTKLTLVSMVKDAL